MRHLFIILMAIAMFSCTSQSQTNPVKEEVAVTTRYQYGSGDVVYQGYLDNAGNLWFATSQEGIYRYDGQSFTNYDMEDGLCGNEVSAIIEDQAGSFWFGTENGLCKFDGKKFMTIALPDYPKKSAWLDKYYPMINPKAATQIWQDKSGAFWVGSNCAGLYRYDGHKFESYLQERGNLMPDSMHHNAIAAIVEDKQGNIWVGSFSHGGISEYDGTKFIHHALKDGIGDGMISSIYIDSKEKMWVGTRNGGIYQYNGKSFVKLPQPEGQEEIPMAKFFEDSRGTLWMSSYARKGVYQYDGTSFVPFQVAKADQLVDVMCIAEDREGNIWFGGRYGLLWQYDGATLSDFTYVKRGE